MSNDVMFTLDDIEVSNPNIPNQTASEFNADDELNNIPDKGENPDPNDNNSNEDSDKDDLLNDDKSDEKNTDNPNKDAETDKSKVPSSNDNISVFAQAFQEEGLLTNLSEEEIKGIKSFADAVKYVQEEANKKAYENLTPTQKRYMDSLNAGIAINEFEDLERELQVIEDITEDTLRNDPKQQFTVLALNFIEKGVDRDLAQEMANALVNKPDGLSKALQARNESYAKKLEAYKEKVDVKKEDNKISVDKAKELVDSKENILGKVPLSKGDKDKIFSKMTTRVDIVDGQQVNEFAKWRMEKGAEAEFILNAIMHFTDNFTSLGKLGITAKTSAAKALEDTLRQNEHKEITDGNSSESNPYNFNF